MKKLKDFFVLWQLMPPPLNKYLYYFSGVKFENLKKTWIGAIHFDNYDPSLITLKVWLYIIEGHNDYSF